MPFSNHTLDAVHRRIDRALDALEAMERIVPIPAPTMVVRAADTLVWMPDGPGGWKAYCYRTGGTYRIAVEDSGSFRFGGTDLGLFADADDRFFANYSTLADAKNHCAVNEIKAVSS